MADALYLAEEIVKDNSKTQHLCPDGLFACGHTFDMISTVSAGTIFCTNIRVVYQTKEESIYPSLREISILIHSIYDVYVNKDKKILTISSQPMHSHSFLFADGKCLKKLKLMIKDNTLPKIGIKQVICFAPNNKPEYKPSGLDWKTQHQYSDFVRQGCRNVGIEDTTRLDKVDFYPERMFLPRSIGNEMIKDAMKIREEHKFPLLLFIRDESALLVAKRATDLEHITVEKVWLAKNTKKPKGALWEIVDCDKEAPQYTNIKNSFSTMLTKTNDPIPWCHFEFLSLADPDAITETYWAMIKSIQTPSTDTLPSFKNICNVMNGFVKGANMVAKKMEENLTVCVQSSGPTNWSHILVSSLAEMILDPYYRTLEGICVLIEKDWVSLRYPFEVRCGFNQNLKLAPYFELFLIIVSWFMTLYPSAFEFSLKFLKDLENESCGLRFYQFCQTRNGRSAHSAASCPAIWDHYLEQKARWTNLYFVPFNASLVISKDPQVCIPSFYYGAHSPFEFSWVTKYVDLNKYHNLREITNLDLMGTGFYSLPDWVFSLVQLKKLVVSHNFLQYLPLELVALKELVLFDVSNNPLQHVSSAYFQFLKKEMPALVEIILVGSMLSGLTMDDFGSVEVLDLSANNFGKYFPAVIEKEKGSLAKLKLRDNGLVAMPQFQSAVQFIDMGSNLLENAYMHDSYIPVETLILDHNKLKSMPELPLVSKGLSTLNLTSLDLSNNVLTSLCPVEWFPPNLKVLILNDNKLGDYFESESSCLPTSLTTLNLANNRLSCMPHKFSSLTSLEHINLSQNRIKEIPYGIRELVNVTHFDIHNNKISRIPLGIRTMSKMEYLDISNNLLSELPLCIVAFSKLLFLKYDGNKRIEGTLPIELQGGPVDPSPLALADFIKRFSESKLPLHRIKIMIVGVENIGKTTVTRALTKAWNSDIETENLQISGDTVSTDGIDITNTKYTWDNTVKGKKQEHLADSKILVDVSFWDFAGQKLYYITHQFFLSERSIYLVMFDIRKPIEESGVEYWLYSVASKINEAQVFLLATHLDSIPNTEEDQANVTKILVQARQKYLVLFPSMTIKVAAISCHGDKASAYLGFDSFRERMEEFIISQSHMGEALPLNHLLLEQIVKEERYHYYPPIIDKSTYLRLARACQFESESAVSKVTKILHDLGVLVYFENDPLLSNYVIINPNFITELLCTLITTKHNFARGGILKHSSLSQIWKPPKYPIELHPHLMGLLQRFEITYELSGVSSSCLFSPRNRPLSSATTDSSAELAVPKSDSAPLLTAPHEAKDETSSAQDRPTPDKSQDKTAEESAASVADERIVKPATPLMSPKAPLRKSSLGDHKLNKIVLPKEEPVNNLPTLSESSRAENVAVPTQPATEVPTEKENEKVEKIKFTIFLPDGQKKSVLSEPHKPLEEVLGKVCDARGWNLHEYLPSVVGGTDEIQLDSPLSSIRESAVVFSPRSQVKFSIFLPDGQKKSLLVYPNQQLEGVLEKVCSARGWKIGDYVPTRVDGSEELKLTTRLSEIKESGVLFSPRALPSLSNKFTLYLSEGMKKSFILSDDTTVEKIIEYMQTYRSNIELSDYSLYNCDAQLVPFDNPTLKLATIKNHVIYLIKNQSEHKVLEIRLVDVKKSVHYDPIMKVSDAVSSMFELKGWSMADFIPHAANQEVPYNIFLGVLQGNVIDLRPRDGIAEKLQLDTLNSPKVLDGDLIKSDPSPEGHVKQANKLLAAKKNSSSRLGKISVSSSDSLSYQKKINSRPKDDDKDEKGSDKDKRKSTSLPVTTQAARPLTSRDTPSRKKSSNKNKKKSDLGQIVSGSKWVDLTQNANAETVFDYNASSLIPCMLDFNKPREIQTYFPTFPTVGVYELGIVYNFDFIPNGLLSRLIVRMLTLYPPKVDTVSFFWVDGIFLQFPHIIELFARQYSMQRSIEVTVRGVRKEVVERYYCGVLEAIKNLLGEWKRLPLKITLKCYECTKLQTATYLSLDEIESHFMAGDSSIKCPKCNTHIQFLDIAPDLNMVYFSGRKITYDQLTIGKELGVGGFATVYKGEFEGKATAVKQLTKQKDDTEFSKAFHEFRREVYAMSALSNDFCVRLYAVCLDPFCLVTEFIAYGDLFALIHEKKTYEFNWEIVTKCALDIARGMECMHGNIPAFLHLDLKSPNILVASLDEKDLAMVKVTDFGLSSTGEFQYTRLVENPVWLAPEILKGLTYGAPSDVYGFGVILYELVTRKQFYGELEFMSEIAENIMLGNRPELPLLMPSLKKLLNSCWDQQPVSRPKFSQIVLELYQIREDINTLYKLARLAILWELFDEAQETMCGLKGPLSKELLEMQQKFDAFFAETIVDSKGYFKKDELQKLSDLAHQFVLAYGEKSCPIATAQGVDDAAFVKFFVLDHANTIPPIKPAPKDTLALADNYGRLLPIFKHALFLKCQTLRNLQSKKLAHPRLYTDAKEKERLLALEKERAQREKEDEELRLKKHEKAKKDSRKSVSEGLTDPVDRRKDKERKDKPDETRSLVRLGKTKSVDKETKGAWRTNRKSESGLARDHLDEAAEETDANGQPVNPSILRTQQQNNSRRISIGKKKSESHLSHSPKREDTTLLSVSLPDLPERPNAPLSPKKESPKERPSERKDEAKGEDAAKKDGTPDKPDAKDELQHDKDKDKDKDSKDKRDKKDARKDRDGKERPKPVDNVEDLYQDVLNMASSDGTTAKPARLDTPVEEPAVQRPEKENAALQLLQSQYQQNQKVALTQSQGSRPLSGEAKALSSSATPTRPLSGSSANNSKPEPASTRPLSGSTITANNNSKSEPTTTAPTTNVARPNPVASLQQLQSLHQANLQFEQTQTPTKHLTTQQLASLALFQEETKQCMRELVIQINLNIVSKVKSGEFSNDPALMSQELISYVAIIKKLRNTLNNFENNECNPPIPKLSTEITTICSLAGNFVANVKSSCENVSYIPILDGIVTTILATVKKITSLFSKGEC